MRNLGRNGNELPCLCTGLMGESQGIGARPPQGGRGGPAAFRASRHLKLKIRMLDDTPILALFLHLSSLAQEKEKERARCGSTQATPFLARILRSELCSFTLCCIAH